VRLAEQWSEVVAGLPRGWQTASVALELDDPAQVDRTALILGPAAPARVRSTFRLDIARGGTAVVPGPRLVARVLERLDREGVAGRLEAVGSREGEAAADGRPGPSSPLAAQWGAVIETLPQDWSHLLAEVDLDSSDFIDRASLLLVPANPSLVRGTRSLRFRAARTAGYGVAVGMAKRCFERLDRERITGRVSLVHVVSDARPVATQGPVWRVGGRSV
jgi:hypothetical protein